MAGLLVFLYNGRVEVDSNAVENLMRPVKLNVKNALFAGHDEGAHGWGRIASLIETCKLNGVEPYAWLKSTLEKIAAGHPHSCIRELLPWNFSSASSWLHGGPVVGKVGRSYRLPAIRVAPSATGSATRWKQLPGFRRLRRLPVSP